VEILFWLLPAAAATLVATVWVSWWGREGRGQVDRDTAARRLGEALSRERGVRPGYAVPARDAEPASGVALRPSKVRPVVLTGADDPEVVVERPSAGAGADAAEVDTPEEQVARDRRAS
jgi:hypothetical protein